MLPVRDITIYSQRALSTHLTALADGFKAHGIKVYQSRSNVPAQTKCVACWGWRAGRFLRRCGHEVLVMERGYFGDRFEWTSLGWNGLNGRATFYTKDDPSRFQANFSHLMQPWQEAGSYVLLIGQVPGDQSLGGMDLGQWYQATAKEAEKAYRLPVRFRPHPVAVERKVARPVAGAPTLNGKLHDALSRAAVVVTFNSNASVESVLAGVPTVAVDDGTMAREVCGRNVGEKITPDRQAWAERLAWCQWRLPEIASGEAWNTVRPQ